MDDKTLLERAAKVNQEAQHLCSVRGLIRPGAMCALVGVSSDEQGRKRCLYAGSCEHQIKAAIGSAHEAQ